MRHIGGDLVTGQVPAGVASTVVDEWAASGPRTLFIHGTGLSRGVWRPIAGVVSGRCHAVALDVRGHGDAPKLDGYCDAASVRAGAASGCKRRSPAATDRPSWR